MTSFQQPLNAEGAEDAQKSQKEVQKENDFSREIIGAAVEVQRVLGTGLLESAYSAATAIELSERELAIAREVSIEGKYKGRELGLAYRADLIVEQAVIVEVKAIEAINELHRAQLLSYLRLSGLKLGLLINFHAFPVVKGVHRLVNKL
ncbi:GxxExxY protein [Ramlibacter terrae]|uniref:GxxExxY protein n=1 Tax=Ramlibacter terrae TaxID=2732511 RepID=A0ABX6P067_9BURK|nr:GxxExxY protein [Ramlibacter terrae]